jgi:3-phytase
VVVMGCVEKKSEKSTIEKRVKPLYITESVSYDSDDPAIWINDNNPSESLILGTDKYEKNGGVYVFDLKGKIRNKFTGLDRPNNIDIAYDFILGTDTIDIAVCTERMTSKIRVFRLPDLEMIDNGGIPVFETSSYKQPMGVALYSRQSDNKIFAVVSRKENPENNNDYLWQYELINQDTIVTGRMVRAFGTYNGDEVEAVAVDNELGFVYYSDEGFGIRKYYADPDMGNNTELAVFGREKFAKDHEGISIYKTGNNTGYLIVSDQGANEFHFYPREGTPSDPHDHPLLKEIPFSTSDSDGSEVTHLSLNEEFPDGMMVAMSDDKTFQIYSWRDVMTVYSETR